MRWLQNGIEESLCSLPTCCTIHAAIFGYHSKRVAGMTRHWLRLATVCGVASVTCSTNVGRHCSSALSQALKPTFADQESDGTLFL